MWNQLTEHISAERGYPFVLRERNLVSGGSINQTFRIRDGELSYFVKVNQAQFLKMFEAEQAGLIALAKTQTIRIPQPLCVGSTAQTSYLVLEWLNLTSDGDWQTMGTQLAALHKTAYSPGTFGWHQNNTIGVTPQLNPWTSDWGTFWGVSRLGYQLELAKQRGFDLTLGSRLIHELPRFFEGYSPQPVLVHGDLWGGNAGFLTTGEPVIFDPAPYYGDREVDMAMTELFGGFPRAFYQGYQHTYPLDSGYTKRKVLYNLYHILNHFNLFGGGYGRQAQQMITQLLTTLRN